MIQASWERNWNDLTEFFNYPWELILELPYQGKREAIKAVMSGTITTADVPTWSKSESTYVVIKGDDGYEYRYVHLDIGPVLTGQRVEQRRIIGFMSDNGAEGQVHPHFEIRNENIPTNPFDYY